MALFYCQIFAASLCFATSGLAMKFSEGLTKPLPSLVLALLVLTGAGFQASWHNLSHRRRTRGNGSNLVRHYFFSGRF